MRTPQATKGKCMPSAIEISGLNKSYGHIQALRELNLSVHWGNVVSVFGPNGSGKTTLIKVLSTLARPDSGIVRIAGLDPRKYHKEIHKRIGVMTHDTFLYSQLTVLENLQFYGRMFGVKNLSSRISSVCQIFKLTSYLDFKVSSLSHGFQKRVSLTRMLLHDPEILLLDEPETGLDEEATVQLMELITNHRAQGRMALMTTHSLELGIGIADQAIILVKGNVVLTNEGRELDPTTFKNNYNFHTNTRIG